jgi:hypothetical protein
MILNTIFLDNKFIIENDHYLLSTPRQSLLDNKNGKRSKIAETLIGSRYACHLSIGQYRVHIMSFAKSFPL